MALTPSTMLELGTTAPAFRLPDTDGRVVTREDFAGAPALVVLFICNHCPYVKMLKESLADLAQTYLARGVAFVAINSNDPERYPEDSPEAMRADKARFRYPFPYLFDATQEVAKAYRAACTPDLFVFDRDLKLAYRGQYDDARPGNGKPVNGADLKAALEALLAGQKVAAAQKPATGCNIKWRPGNEPAYA